ncbi:MAG: iron complex outermembrane receptor protein [Lysobacterales bacterium]|jgi:iron complex outermembrane receptor protein
MPNKRQLQRKSLAAAVATACITMSTAQQVRAQDDGASLLEEIIVTATRREQTVQDIPYNISAMSGDAINLLNIVDQAEMLRAMHGITVVDRGFRNGGTTNSIVIRGLNVDGGGNGDVYLNAVPTVGTYYDNTPVFANFLIKDIERVEVLRGPQGTLYGSGSLGGTVRYIGNKPNPEAFESSVSVDYGQTSGSEGNNRAADVMLNLPIGETAAVRISYSNISNDGVIDYVNAYQLSPNREPLVWTDGGCVAPQAATTTEVLYHDACFTNIEDADTVDIDFYKVAFRAQPTDDFTLQLSYYNQEDEIGSRRSTAVGNNNQPVGSDLFFAYGDDDSGQLLLEPSSREAELLSLDLEWDFGFATLTSSTSSYDHTGRGESDNGYLWSGSNWNYLFYGGQWPRPAQRAERGYTDEALIQEFRLVSNEREGSIDWLVGAFFMDQETSSWQLSHNPGMNEFNLACRESGDPICTTGGIYGGFWPRWYPELTEIDFDYLRETDFEEKAIYGELTYHMSDTARVTGGLRWFDNETVNNTHSGFPLVVGFTNTQFAPTSASDSDVLFKLNGSWDLADNKMLYATYSEGYRHGGAQAVPALGEPFGEPNAAAIREFDADSVSNYEIGLKGTVGNMSYTASAFYVDWDNPQLNTTTQFFAFFIAANGDKASTQGIELELEGYINESTHYRVGYTHVNAELDRDFISPQTGNIVAPSGTQLPGAPDNTLSFSLDKSWHLNGDRDLVVGFNGYYQSDSENFVDPSSAWAQTWSSYTLLGASATYVADNWSATLYVKNLGDEEGISGGFPEGVASYDTGIFENWYGNGNRNFIVQPRTIGLKFGYRF